MMPNAKNTKTQMIWRTVVISKPIPKRRTVTMETNDVLVDCPWRVPH
jgi:hypothetical protein